MRLGLTQLNNAGIAVVNDPFYFFWQAIACVLSHPAQLALGRLFSSEQFPVGLSGLLPLSPP